MPAVSLAGDSLLQAISQLLLFRCVLMAALTVQYKAAGARRASKTAVESDSGPDALRAYNAGGELGWQGAGLPRGGCSVCMSGHSLSDTIRTLVIYNRDLSVRQS